MSAKMQTWSVFPMGKRYPRAFSSCRYCSSWQSTRYSMVFIICASASTARRSFSMRLCRNSGLKAISASASNTCSQRHSGINPDVLVVCWAYPACTGK